MRLCRFDDDRLGLITGGQVRDVTAVLDAIPPQRPPYPPFDPVILALPHLRGAILAEAEYAEARPLAGQRLLPPVWHPGKVVAAPVNYRKHLEEAREDPGLNHGRQVETIRKAGLFLKATSSLIGPSDPVRLRHLDRRNDHEVELAVIIGRRADRVPAAEAMKHVAGYCIGLDMTVRGTEDRSFRKSGDTYTVLGPCMVTADELGDPSDLALELTVNGAVRQSASTRDLVLSVPELIEFASAFYTLHPGDVLLTGTPEGVGPVEPGDIMIASIARIGEMTVRVASG
ncbi:fumarylacetoacetate hydrolase family protein [Muricoccus radiodurans]|uniref:fumarylacetoacetate hydrolase family protein n=1 Tax=Muricoccus radiodurans TaxID=2231721 RepID=UPI003CE81CCE